ncbi:MAG: hypothetical protein ACYC56_02690 [Candidatus Aquicultor sp.]
MVETRMETCFSGGFPVIKVKGSLELSTLNSIHLLARGYSEHGEVPVIIDIAECSSISDQVRSLSCRKIAAWLSKMTLVIAGPPDRTALVQTILDSPHKLRYASDVTEAVDILKEDTEGFKKAS